MPSIAPTNDTESIRSSPTLPILCTSGQHTTDTSTKDVSSLERVSTILEFALVTVTEIPYWLSQDDNISQQSTDHASLENRPTIPAVDATGKDYKVNFLGPPLRTETMDTIDILIDRQNIARNSASMRSTVKSLGDRFRRRSRSKA